MSRESNRDRMIKGFRQFSKKRETTIPLPELGAFTPSEFELSNLGINIPNADLDSDPQLREIFWTQAGVQQSLPNLQELAWE